jgi:hypothetical protein
MSERSGSVKSPDILIPYKDGGGCVVINTSAIFSRMAEGDDQLGTRDLDRLVKALSHDDPRKREIKQTLEIQRLLQAPELKVQYDKSAEVFEINGPEDIAKEAEAWLDLHRGKLMLITDVQDED